MKEKHHTNIETLLESQKEVGLTVSERTEMFSELQAFTALHTPFQVTAPSPVKQQFHFFSKWSVAAASVFLVTVSTGVASTQSLPGDTLYEMKVSVVEPIVGFAQWSDTDQLVYQIGLMERRLAEMEALYRADELTETKVLVLETQIGEQSEAFEMLVTGTDTAEITTETSLNAVSEITVMLRKQSYLIDKKLGNDRPSKLDSAQVSIQALYQEELVEFIAAAPEAVPEYVETLLVDIASEVSANPDTASSSAVKLSEYLDDVEATLKTGDLKGAVEFAEDAQQLLETKIFFEALDESSVKEDNGGTGS